MLYVSLNNIEINGLHGAYPEEKILGSNLRKKYFTSSEIVKLNDNKSSFLIR